MSEAVERGGGLVREGNFANAAALRGLHLGLAGQGSADDGLAADEIDIAPAEGDELAPAEAGVRRHTHELGVLNVLTGPSDDLRVTQRTARRVSMSAVSQVILSSPSRCISHRTVPSVIGRTPARSTLGVVEAYDDAQPRIGVLLVHEASLIDRSAHGIV